MSKLYLLLTSVLLSFSLFAQPPADEDFQDDDYTGNFTLTLTNDGVTYFQDGVPEDGQFIEIYEQSAYGLNFPSGSKALVYNVGQAYGGSYYGFRSENGAEFRLASVLIDIVGDDGTAEFATEYTIRGYRNGVEQIVEVIDFSTSATYGSISYTKDPVYYYGGTLTFNSSTAWENIDEIRFYWNNNLGMFGAIKSIDFEPAVTGTLPVSLIDYNATVQVNGHVKIQWSTADETGNSHFIIERAVNPTEFSMIGRVQGNGTQTNRADYSFTDIAPFAGTSYYRLTQYDFDGSHKTYKVLTVRKKSDGCFNVYPNPIDANGFTITLDNAVTVPVHFTLYSISGKPIITGTITSRQQFIPISSPLAKGTYVLMMSNGASLKLIGR